MRWLLAALACFAVAAGAYVVRGPEYLDDTKNGGMRDWLTVSIIYLALVGLVAVCCAPLVLRAREGVREARRNRTH